jgi:hypothetical protein
MPQEQLLMDRLKQFALRWSGLRWGFAGSLLLSLVYCIYVLLVSNTRGQDIYFIPSLLLAIWSLLGVTFISAFQHVPTPALPSERWKERFFKKIVRMAYCLLALMMGIVGLSVIVVTWQLSSAWREMY